MAASKKKAETAAIEIPRLSIEEMEVTVIGDAPLITHAWSHKARLEMLNKQMKKATAKKEAKDPISDFKASIHWLDDQCAFPSVAFKAAAVTAITSVSGVTKVAARQAFHIIGEDVEVAGAFPGSVSRYNLVRLQGGQPRMREDMVRVGMGTADLRYRGEFWPCFVQVRVRYNRNALSAEQILNIINTAGFGVGVGEWRPEKDGDKGLFHVAQDGEVDRLLASLEAKEAA